MYFLLGTLTLNSTAETAVFAPAAPNTGAQALAQLWGVLKLPVTYEIAPTSSLDAITIDHSGTATTLLKAGTFGYFGWRPATTDWGVGTIPGVDPVCYVRTDGAGMVLGLTPLSWLAGAQGWSGTFEDADSQTVTVVAGRITGVA